MTHLTDEELDELVARLLDGPSRVYRDIEAGKKAAAAITTLRTQLAEAQADLTFMTEDRNKWQDSATQRWFRIEEANARFIAAARDLVPALLKERDDLRAKQDAAMSAGDGALRVAVKYAENYDA